MHKGIGKWEDVDWDVLLTYNEWLESGGPERAEKERLASGITFPPKGFETARCPNCMNKMTRKVDSGSFRCKTCHKQQRKAS